MTAIVLPNPSLSWLSLISEASESDESVPTETKPCKGGLSCDLTPYSSIRVRLARTDASALRRGLARAFGIVSNNDAPADSVDVGLDATRTGKTSRRRAPKRAA